MRQELYEVLSKPKKIERRIERYNIQIAKLEHILLPRGITYDRDKVQSSQQDKLGAVAAEINDLEQNRAQAAVEYNAALKAVNALMQCLTQDSEIDLISKRYVEGKSFRQIAIEMDYSEDGIYSLHRRTIKKIEIAQLNTVQHVIL